MQRPTTSPLGTLSTDDLLFVPPDLPLPVLQETLLRDYGIDGMFKRLSGERDQNLRVRTKDDTEYLLKVASPAEDPALIDFQIESLLHLAQRDPDLPIPRMIPSQTGEMTVKVVHEGETHVVRLLSYVPGTPLSLSGHVTEQLAQSLGQVLGQINHAFAGFSHPAATKFMPWNTLNGLLESPQLADAYLPDHLQHACAPVIDRLARVSLPAMRDMPHAVIHYDSHSGNVLIARDNADEVCGLIDFGDMIAGPILQDLATPLASLIEHGADPVGISVALLGGFAKAHPIPLDQLPYLHDAILARLILTVELLTFRIRHDLSEAEALEQTELPRSIRALERQLEMDPQDFIRRIMDAVSQTE
ncbi:phosphotransferase [Phaeobacter sp. HF9A]|uniref:phosphotransferase n=1 Tax=Phaeobacter sp. HF9A TaxID=2721561 RepID=UPI0014318ADF|nr:phosphotransferase [Phaeobacter sp. HF9A]NIZ12990.1 phosphotransferase [Phaeobacter sp. HF9A]